jgi:ribosomal protein S18 acetylase RimI-like enzyme
LYIIFADHTKSGKNIKLFREGKVIIFLILFSWVSCVYPNGTEPKQLQRLTPKTDFLDSLGIIETSPEEAVKIHQRMALFYGEQLFEAKVIEDKTKALEAALEECNENPHKIYYHLVLKESKCGYLAYTIENRTAYLEAFYLEQDYRGRGLATQLLQNLEAQLKAKNIDTIELYVFAHNHPAIKLYERLGYTIENTYWLGTNLIGHRMKKPLQGTS